jgi:hypothetical protein
MSIFCLEGAERRKCVAMHTRVRVLWRWIGMSVSGQLCWLAEGLSYNDITLAHSHPPPSREQQGFHDEKRQRSTEACMVATSDSISGHVPTRVVLQPTL